MERDRLVARPAATSRSATSVTRSESRSMRSPWKAGQQQPALVEVRLLVEQDERVAAHDRLQQPRALAGVEHLRGRGQDLLALVHVREVDERVLAGKPDA